MSFQNLLNSRLAIALILFLGRIIPPRLGYPLGEWLAKLVASFKQSRIVKSVRANQWVVSGMNVNAPELDEITRETFIQTANCLYDFYHYLPYPQQSINMVTLSDNLKRVIATQAKLKKGLILLAPHLSNFDLAGRVLTLMGYKVMVLSYPQPNGGYQWQNKLRKDYGVDIHPMSTTSMRSAIERLRNGGVILTGLDRPLENSHYHENFFGHLAAMPAAYVRMGIITQSPIVVASCISNGRGSYIVECSDFIEMTPYDDANSEIVNNVEKVLKEAEKTIGRVPSQWSMFYPVWPWALDQMP